MSIFDVNSYLFVWTLLGLAVVCLLAGCLFFSLSFLFGRKKDSLESCLVLTLADDDIHDLFVEMFMNVKLLYRICKYSYVTFFTLSLVCYTGYSYLTSGAASFDLVAFCISVTVSVFFTLAVSLFSKTMFMKTSMNFQCVLGGILAILWTASLFFFFYLFPSLGMITAVLFIVSGIWIYGTRSKKNNLKE